jgi:hypothetical protein
LEVIRRKERIVPVKQAWPSKRNTANLPPTYRGSSTKTFPGSDANSGGSTKQRPPGGKTFFFEKESSGRLRARKVGCEGRRSFLFRKRKIRHARRLRRAPLRDIPGTDIFICSACRLTKCICLARCALAGTIVRLWTCPPTCKRMKRGCWPPCPRSPRRFRGDYFAVLGATCRECLRAAPRVRCSQD